MFEGDDGDGRDEDEVEIASSLHLLGPRRLLSRVILMLGPSWISETSNVCLAVITDEP